jgi:hypothetical protein
MFVSFSLLDHKRRFPAAAKHFKFTGLDETAVEIKAGRDSPLSESRPASSLAVGIVLPRR